MIYKRWIIITFKNVAKIMEKIYYAHRLSSKLLSLHHEGVFIHPADIFTHKRFYKRKEHQRIRHTRKKSDRQHYCRP